MLLRAEVSSKFLLSLFFYQCFNAVLEADIEKQMVKEKEIRMEPLAQELNEDLVRVLLIVRLGVKLASFFVTCFFFLSLFCLSILTVHKTQNIKKNGNKQLNQCKTFVQHKTKQLSSLPSKFLELTLQLLLPTMVRTKWT